MFPSTSAGRTTEAPNTHDGLDRFHGHWLKATRLPATEAVVVGSITRAPRHPATLMASPPRLLQDLSMSLLRDCGRFRLQTAVAPRRPLEPDAESLAG